MTPGQSILSELMDKGVSIEAHGDRLRFSPEGLRPPPPIGERPPPQADVPEGWTLAGWCRELRRMAGCCEALHPDKAAEYRRRADDL